MTGSDWIAGLVAAYGGRPSATRSYEQGQRERGEDIPNLPTDDLQRERSQLIMLLTFFDPYHVDTAWYEQRRAWLEGEMARRSRPVRLAR